jgi:nitroreductase
MDVKEAIEKRKSIRRFKQKQVPDKIIKEVIDAARRAPSGCNVQPTRYFVIKDKKLKERLKQKEAFRQDFVYDAPVIIVLCGNPKEYENFKEIKYQQEEGTLPKDLTKVKEILKGLEEERAIRDISIASSFLVLRAVELGLGVCYIGLINENALKKELNIPKKWIIPFIIIMGYPAEFPQQRPRKNLDEIMKFVK